MKSHDSRNVQAEVRVAWQDEYCRRLLCRQLQRIERGSLRIEQGEEVMLFGKVDDQRGNHAVIRVRDARVWRQVVLNGTTGSGEAYMSSWWDTPDLTAVIRLFVANRDVMQQLNGWRSLASLLVRKGLHFLNRNSESGSQRNIAAHYDLGNDFFALFLDPTMMYSSAIYRAAHTPLEEAAVEKLRVVCETLQLSSEDHLLEIGSGWGGMAVYAAQHYGCRVTTTTISREQYALAQERVQKAGLQDRVTVLLQDYRKLEGRYSKIVSIEMIEAVGAEYYGTFFRQCEKLLADDGLMLIQAITIPDRLFAQYQRDVDFIRRYIFPGGCLPSIEQLTVHAARASSMQVTAVRDITLDYAYTLRDWRKRFLQQHAAVLAQGYSEEFVRMWEFYLCYCEGGFLERNIGTHQLLFSKPGYRGSIVVA